MTVSWLQFGLLALVAGCGTAGEPVLSGDSPAVQAKSDSPKVLADDAEIFFVTDTSALPAAAAPTASATKPKRDVEVKPFGELAWTDTLLEAAAKVQKLEGASDVNVLLIQRRLPVAQVVGPKKLPTFFAGLFAQSAAYRNEFLDRDPMFKLPIYKSSLAGSPGVEAKGLKLGGLPYNVRVNFKTEKGLLLTNEAAVAKQSSEFFGDGAAQQVPLVLESVELNPTGFVSGPAYRDLARSLRKKYDTLLVTGPQFPVNPDDIEKGMLVPLEFRDDAGNSLNLYPGGRVVYRNGLTQGENSLQKIYEQRRAEWDEAQRQQKIQPEKDLLDDL